MEDAGWRDIVMGTLIGIAAIIVVLALLGATFGLGFLTAQDNNEKTRQLTEYCVSQGYDGFTDDLDDSQVGCYKS